MSRSHLLTSAALLVLSAAASAQLNAKLGYSQGDRPGVYAGLDWGKEDRPIRFDLDAYSAFQDFGDRSSALAITANYVERYRRVYGGLGVGYMHGRERGDAFDSVATKLILGGKLPGSNLSLEGSLIWAQHSIGSVHTVGVLALVYRL